MLHHEVELKSPEKDPKLQEWFERLDYLDDKNLYRAVTGALILIRSGVEKPRAIHRLAKKWKVKRRSVTDQVNKAMGTMEEFIEHVRKKKRTPRARKAKARPSQESSRQRMPREEHRSFVSSVLARLDDEG